MIKLKLGIFIGISVLIMGGGYTKRHALACEFVGLTNYIEIDQNIFLSPEIDPKYHQKFKSYVLEGRKRIQTTFGGVIASPTIIFSASKKEAAFYGANSTATSHLTPMGTCIILGPKGHNIDVTAHELVHAEVLERVGFINYLLEIPVWFNEGIALIVDHREPYLLENIDLTAKDIENVKTKFMGSDFFDGPNIHQHYLASRIAVKPLNPASLFAKLKHIHDGQKFITVFTKIINRPI